MSSSSSPDYQSDSDSLEDPRFPASDEKYYTAPLNLPRERYESILNSGVSAMKEFAPLLINIKPNRGWLVPGEKNKTPWRSTTNEEAPSTSFSSPGYKVVDMPGKGKGMVATRDRVAGEVVLVESPILMIKSSSFPPRPSDLDYLIIEEELSKRLKEERDSYYSLSSASTQVGRPPSLAIWFTNGYEFEVEADQFETAVFDAASRFNHSCSSNISRIWIKEERKAIFFASRDVRKGEELYTDYTGLYRTRENRQQHLSRGYGFSCDCEVCSLPLEESRRNDQARLELVRISDHLEAVVKKEDLPLRFHGICCRGLEIIRKENIFSFLELELAHGAYMVSILFGYRPIANIWIDELLKLSKRHGIFGKERVDRHRFYEVMKEDPTCHPAWGIMLKEEEE